MNNGGIRCINIRKLIFKYVNVYSQTNEEMFLDREIYYARTAPLQSEKFIVKKQKKLTKHSKNSEMEVRTR